MEKTLYIDGKEVTHFLGKTYTDGTNFYVRGPGVKIEEPEEGKLEGTVHEEVQIFVKLDPELVSQFKMRDVFEISRTFSGE